MRPAGRGYKSQLLPALTVAMNFSFRLANSFMRFKASFSDTLARGGRSTLISLISFALFITPPRPFSYIRSRCQRSHQTSDCMLSDVQSRQWKEYYQGIGLNE